jgi:hypothetical protein
MLFENRAYKSGMKPLPNHGSLTHRNAARMATQSESGLHDDGPEIEMAPFEELPDFAIREHSVQRNTANGGLLARQTPEDEELPEFEPKTVPSNRDETSRRPKEFAARHIQMMAIGTASQLQVLTLIGAAIGNGLLIQSAESLYLSGPVPLLLAYLFIGSLVYAVMVVRFVYSETNYSRSHLGK